MLAAAVMLVASCGGHAGSEFAPIPTRSAPPAPVTPPLTAPDGTLAVTEFHAPTTFDCLAADETEALATIGWDVPSATDVRVSLNGQVLPTGTHNPIPYVVPAGGPTGVGATIVFPCAGPPQRTIDIEWTAGGARAAHRTMSITKG